MTGSLPLIASAFVSAFWAGFMLALRPRQLLADPNRARGLDFAVAALAVPFMFVAGLLADKWGVETVLMLGSCLAALSFIGLDRGHSLVPALGAAALLAGAIAALLVGSVVLMPRAFFSTHPARAINFGFVAVVLGGLGAARLAQLANGKLEGHRLLLVFAVASLVPGACVAFTPTAEFGEPVASDFTPLLANPRLGLLLVVAMLCFPLDGLLGPWLRQYIREHRSWSAFAGVVAVGFWVAFLGTRLIAAFFLPTGWEHIWIIIWAILAVITCSNVLGAYSPSSNVIGIWLLGACCGPILPTVLGLAVQRHADCVGTVIGLTAAAGMLGNLLVLPWIDATRAECSSRTALRGATALAVVLLVPALVLAVLG